jgi:hypothetical protein
MGEADTTISCSAMAEGFKSKEIVAIPALTSTVLVLEA